MFFVIKYNLSQINTNQSYEVHSVVVIDESLKVKTLIILKTLIWRFQESVIHLSASNDVVMER